MSIGRRISDWEEFLANLGEVSQQMRCRVYYFFWIYCEYVNWILLL